MPLRSPPAPRFLVFTIGPVVIACAATMFFGNAAYLYLSLAFIQVLKAATPAITLLLGLFARVETVTVKLLFALTLIVGGTG
jgi:drug/metabolite transporter (DMT)-like permease